MTTPPPPAPPPIPPAAAARRSTTSTRIVTNDFRIVISTVFIGFAMFIAWLLVWVELKQKTFTAPTVAEDALVLVPMVLGFTSLFPSTVTFLVTTLKPILPSWGRKDS